MYYNNFPHIICCSMTSNPLAFQISVNENFCQVYLYFAPSFYSCKYTHAGTRLQICNPCAYCTSSFCNFIYIQYICTIYTVWCIRTGHFTISKFMYPTYYMICNSEYMYKTTEVLQHLILRINVQIYIYSTVCNPYHFQLCK
jgi:hypothetical protein